MNKRLLTKNKNIGIFINEPILKSPPSLFCLKSNWTLSKKLSSEKKIVKINVPIKVDRAPIKNPKKRFLFFKIPIV